MLLPGDTSGGIQSLLIHLVDSLVHGGQTMRCFNQGRIRSQWWWAAERMEPQSAEGLNLASLGH